MTNLDKKMMARMLRTLADEIEISSKPLLLHHFEHKIIIHDENQVVISEELMGKTIVISDLPSTYLEDALGKIDAIRFDYGS